MPLDQQHLPEMKELTEKYEMGEVTIPYRARVTEMTDQEYQELEKWHETVRSELPKELLGGQGGWISVGQPKAIGHWL